MKLRLAALCLLAGTGPIAPDFAAAKEKPAPAAESDAQAFLRSPEAKRLREKAKAGDAEAMVALGDAIGRTLSSDAPPEAAAEQRGWYVKAADKHFGPAYFRLGVLALRGSDAGSGPDAALRYFEKGADLGDPAATLAAAQLYLASSNCDDCARAEKAGGEAQPGSVEEALDAMATQREPAAAGKDGIAKAIALLKRPAVEEDPRARRLLVSAYLAGDHPQGEKAATLLEEMAAKGPEATSRWAAALLGTLSIAGIDGVPRDGKAAEKYLTLAAQKGDGAAAARLGDQIMIGKLLPRDPKKALGLFQLADKLGSSDGTLSLGMMYRGGFGVKQDDSKAIALVEQAARSGNARAAAQAAKLWEKGVNGKSDPVKASYWLQKEKEFRALAAGGQPVPQAQGPAEQRPQPRDGEIQGPDLHGPEIEAPSR